MMTLRQSTLLALNLGFLLAGAGCGASTDTEPVDTDTDTTPTPHHAGDTACQNVEGDGPWVRDLEEWTSADGTTFTQTRRFQVCADVPSIAQHADGTLIAAFQGFQDPETDAHWDKIAVRLSEDGGINWTVSQFIELSDFPEGSGRPFDPTITFDLTNDRWRMYFSLSLDGSQMLNDSVCTRSAYSEDGITYVYEEGDRYCASEGAVIDPAVAHLDGTWYYVAPRGAPQDGARFATSTDGLDFTAGDPIPSDNNHNWTGNLSTADDGLRFYGAEGLIPSGNYLWWSSTSDGGASWSDYTRTNVPAGKDPGIIQLADTTWLLLVPTRNE
jgi:hypothetical protein